LRAAAARLCLLTPFREFAICGLKPAALQVSFRG
jgi:hypothetical protein